MKNIAVLIPCHNEEQTIAQVIQDFRQHIPNSMIYVYDNLSTDNTYKVASEAGAIVVKANKKGKGNVLRKMFSDINADIYIIVDGDSTYCASDAPKMIAELESNTLDMVVARRKAKNTKSYPGGHKIGNKIFNWILKAFFGSTFSDIFSGYRVLSKRFVKTFPIMSSGFDIEAELSIHALTLSIPFSEMDSNYYERPVNSHSKLNTIIDGSKILMTIIRFFKETRPLLFFGIISLMMLCLSIFLAYPIFDTFIKTGLVPRLPTALLSTGIMIISFLSLTCGMILNSLSKARIETKKLHYLLF